MDHAGLGWRTYPGLILLGGVSVPNPGTSGVARGPYGWTRLVPLVPLPLWLMGSAGLSQLVKPHQAQSWSCSSDSGAPVVSTAGVSRPAPHLPQSSHLESIFAIPEEAYCPPTDQSKTTLTEDHSGPCMSWPPIASLPPAFLWTPSVKPQLPGSAPALPATRPQ